MTGAEDKALQGCNLSADSGAKTRKGGETAPFGFELSLALTVKPGLAVGIGQPQ